MTGFKNFLQQQIAICLVIILAVPFGEAATKRQQQDSTQQAGNASATGQPQAPATPGLNASTGNTGPAPAAASTGITTSPAEASQSTSSANSSNQSASSPQSGSQPEKNGASQPLGTAAAPYEKTTGIGISRPAGAVIAPAKQKRARSILIRVGLLLGAAVAIGTVVGLSAASPNRPY